MQLGTAFRLYVTDNAGRYPGAAPFQKWGSGGHWVAGTNDEPLANSASPFAYLNREANVEGGALYSYVKAAGVYVCPSTQDGQKKRLTYSMNCAVGGMSDLRIKQPAEIVLLVDESISLNDGYFWAVSDPSSSLYSFSTDTLNSTHNGGGNLLFADGHVKFFPFSSFPLDSSPEGLANKTRATGEVRFHDRAFGPLNSYKVPGAVGNACGEPN